MSIILKYSEISSDKLSEKEAQTLDKLMNYLRMLRTILISTLLWIPSITFAAGESGVAKVIIMRGIVEAVNADGSKESLAKGAWVKEGAKVLTQDKSFVKLLFTDKSQMNLGPKSEMVIEKFPKKKAGIISLMKGSLRSKVTKNYLNKGDEKKSKLFVKTKSAAMGVRGTDFEVTPNSLDVISGEVRVINKAVGSFDQDSLDASLNSKDAASVKKGESTQMDGNAGKPVVRPIPKAKLERLKKNDVPVVSSKKEVKEEKKEQKTAKKEEKKEKKKEKKEEKKEEKKQEKVAKKDEKKEEKKEEKKDSPKNEPKKQAAAKEEKKAEPKKEEPKKQEQKQAQNEPKKAEPKSEPKAEPKKQEPKTAQNEPKPAPKSEPKAPEPKPEPKRQANNSPAPSLAPVKPAPKGPAPASAPTPAPITTRAAPAPAPGPAPATMPAPGPAPTTMPAPGPGPAIAPMPAPAIAAPPPPMPAPDVAGAINPFQIGGSKISDMGSTVMNAGGVTDVAPPPAPTNPEPIFIAPPPPAPVLGGEPEITREPTSIAPTADGGDQKVNDPAPGDSPPPIVSGPTWTQAPSGGELPSDVAPPPIDPYEILNGGGGDGTDGGAPPIVEIDNDVIPTAEDVAGDVPDVTDLAIIQEVQNNAAQAQICIKLPNGASSCN